MRNAVGGGENVRNAVGGEHEECNGREGGRNIYHKVHSCPSPALPRSLCSGHWGMSLTNLWSIGYVRRTLYINFRALPDTNNCFH